MVGARRSAAAIIGTSFLFVVAAAGPCRADYTYTTLIDPNSSVYGANVFANGINNTGQTVGYYTDSNYVFRGFVYSGGSNGTYTALDDPNAATNVPFSGTLAQGINASGQVVGAYYDENGVTHGFLYSAGTYTTFDDPLGVNGTYGTGINASGQVVGDYFDANNALHGFLYSGGTYTTLDDPNGVNGTSVLGINASGQVVGFFIDSNDVTHGFVYSGGTYTTLDDPLGVNGTLAVGINASGQIVGSFTDSTNVAHGFLYSGGTYTTLDDPNVDTIGGFPGTGTNANGINDSGQVVGNYFNANYFSTYGFLATPLAVPEPASLAMTAGALGAVGVGAQVRRRRTRAMA